MIVVHKSQTSLGDDGRTLTAFASDLELPPGQWPQSISVVDDHNEGFVFLRDERITHHGELGGFTYVTPVGNLTLTVFND